MIMPVNIYLIALISSILIIYLFVQYILNEKQIYMLKYTLYVALVMCLSVLTIPIFLIRPRNADNIRLAAMMLNPLLDRFGWKYRIENGDVFNREGACIIVANHQSSIDFIGMMKLWSKSIRYCTILAKKEIIYALPFGFTAWLAGVEFVDRQNRIRSSETMRVLAEKIREKSLKLWIFPEGKHSPIFFLTNFSLSGTRNMTDTLLPFKYGAFRLAIESQLPIIPVVFSSYHSIYNADKKTNRYYWRPGHVTIQCLEPIDTKGMTIEDDLQRLTSMTRQRMIETYAMLDKKNE